jgi:hypothetical protein
VGVLPFLTPERSARQSHVTGTRVVPVMEHALCGGWANRMFAQVNGRIACGSMVLFFLFHKTFVQSINVL